MAKIADFKFELNGQPQVVHVNCNSAGQFSANLPGEVWKRLDLKNKLVFDSLDELKKVFYDALARYKNASITQELLIGIKYGSIGKLNQDKHGKTLHHEQGYDAPYGIAISFSDDSDNALLFGFQVVIRESVDGVITLYDAELGKDHAYWDEEQRKEPNKYFKSGQFSHEGKFKFIPFSEPAFESLKSAQEKLRSISEMLFRFIEQKPAQIEATLTKTKLLQ